MSNLATIRAAVRQDLHDEDATAYKWTDAVLNRHIQRAVRRYSLASPLEDKDGLTTTPNSRDLSVTSLAPRIRIVAVEYPTGKYPPAYTPFSLWVDTLTLDLISPPSGAEPVNVYWEKEHTINGTVSFPATHDDIIATGAAAYAAGDRQMFATDRINTGGQETPGWYAAFAKQRLAEFEDMLRDLPKANTIRSHRLYTPDSVRIHSETTDPGPIGE